MLYCFAMKGFRDLFGMLYCFGMKGFRDLFGMLYCFGINGFRDSGFCNSRLWSVRI